MAYTRLDDLEKEKISKTSTYRLQYVIDSLDRADDLNGDLTWQTKIWGGCTIEELLGGLIEAENVLEWNKEMREELG